MRQVDETVFDGLEEIGRTFRARKIPVEVDVHGPVDVPCEIKTREGTVVAEPGDYIIRGVEGEVYPIDADVFDQTYEVVGDAD
jgi:hypothetical protein